MQVAEGAGIANGVIGVQHRKAFVSIISHRIRAEFREIYDDALNVRASASVHSAPKLGRIAVSLASE